MPRTKGRRSGTLKQADRKDTRLFSVDALRGLIAIFMALDHANLLVAQKHSPGEYWGGAFPVYYDALAFVTRFVTHLCAPGFFFLMGAGMALLARSRQRQGWSKWAIIRHFFLRGVLFVVLQLLVINRAWELSPGGWGIQAYIGVLFALGVGMIAGSLLLWLKPTYLLCIAVGLLIGTELLVPDPSLWGPGKGPLELILLVPGGWTFGAGKGNLLWVTYPVLPWLELIVFGLAFGQWLAEDPRRAFKRALVIGAACIPAFAAIRYLDGFGNIRPRMGNSWTDFLNPVKYPPSITFTLLTMGINLVLLWLFAQVRERWQKYLLPLVVFGRAPLFFYLTHPFLYLVIAYLLTPKGTSIPVMYPLWLLGLLILFPLCWWYGRIKQRQLSGSVLRFL
jgi:uncharacterized membrane protein